MILPEEMKSVLFLRELGEAYLRQVAAMACLICDSVSAVLGFLGRVIMEYWGGGWRWRF